MSIQRQKHSSRSKQVLVKVNHLSKRLPQDFFMPKALSSSPAKRQCDTYQQVAKDWYQRDDSVENSPTKDQLRFARTKKPTKMAKITEDKQLLQTTNQDKTCFNKLMENINYKQSIILRAVKQTQKESRVKVVPSKCEPGRSRERLIKSQNKRYRRNQSVFKGKDSVVQKARITLQEAQVNLSPGREQKINMGFDGLLTFNRFE